jgi:hypothetical protein
VLFVSDDDPYVNIFTFCLSFSFFLARYSAMISFGAYGTTYPPIVDSSIIGSNPLFPFFLLFFVVELIAVNEDEDVEFPPNAEFI